MRMRTASKLASLSKGNVSSHQVAPASARGPRMYGRWPCCRELIHRRSARTAHRRDQISSRLDVDVFCDVGDHFGGGRLIPGAWS